MSEDQKTYHVSELIRASDERDQLQARCEELEAAHETERQDRLRLQDRFIEMERENAQQRERIGELASTLLVHIDNTICPDCERYIVDGEPHDETCRYAPVVAEARAMFEDGEEG